MINMMIHIEGCTYLNMGRFSRSLPKFSNLGNWQLLGIALKEKEKHNQNTGDLKDLKNKSKHHTHKRKPKNISSNQHAGHHLFRRLWLLIRNPSRPYIYVYICMYVCMYVCTYVCMYVRIYLNNIVFTCIYVYIYVCVHIYI